MIRYKIALLRTFESIHLPDVGDLGNCLPHTKCPMAMERLENGDVILTYHDKSGKQRQSIVGAANVRVAADVTDLDAPVAKVSNARK